MNLNGSGTNITLKLSQLTRLSHTITIMHFYKLRDHFLTRHKTKMVEMTDITFISHTPE